MRILSILLVCAAAAACSGGYAARDPRTGTEVVRPVDGLVPSGARVWLRLDQPLPDETPAGETFRARVAGDVLTPHGQRLIPRGARVTGRIVPNASGDPWLVIDSLEMRGVVQRVDGWVVGIQAPGRVGDERPDRRTFDEGLDDDLPTGTRIELRLSAPVMPLPERDV